jgi:hypothetical protein
MTPGEPKGLSQAMVDSRRREVSKLRELPHRGEWILVESGHDGLIGVVDRLPIVGTGRFLRRKKKFRLMKEA